MPTVWLINQYAVTPDAPGITRHYELGKLLPAHGWSAIVYATGFNHYSGTFSRSVSWRRWVRTRDEGGVTFRWLYSIPYHRNDWRRYRNVLSFAATLLATGAITRSLDVVIGSSPHPLTAFIAWLLARRHHARFIFEVRDLWPDQLIEMGLTNKVIIVPLKVMERFLYQRADRIVSLSEGITDGIVDKGVLREKVVLIPNAPLQPPPVDPVRREEVRHRLGWDGKIAAIYAGSHNPSYDLANVIEAARLSRDATDVLWVLVGDGSEKPKLMERAADLPNILFMDAVPQGEILDIMRAADIGLLIRPKMDVFSGIRPVKMLEYMAAALPIVSTMPGEVKQMLDEAGAGVTTAPEESAPLAAAVKALAADPRRREEMGRRGFAYMLEHYTRERTARQLAALLHEVTEGRAAGRAGSEAYDSAALASDGEAVVQRGAESSRSREVA